MRLLTAILCALVCACASPTSPTVSTGAPGATTAVADKPPINPNPALSCPSESPDELVVVVDDFVASKGGWKVTIDLRRVGVNVNNYIIWYQRSAPGEPVKSMTLPGTRPIDTIYLSPAGVYGFRAQSSCFDGGYGPLGRVVVKNVGGGSFGPDVPPPPVVPPPPSPCVQPNTTGTLPTPKPPCA